MFDKRESISRGLMSLYWVSEGVDHEKRLRNGGVKRLALFSNSKKGHASRIASSIPARRRQTIPAFRRDRCCFVTLGIMLFVEKGAEISQPTNHVVIFFWSLHFGPSHTSVFGCKPTRDYLHVVFRTRVVHCPSHLSPSLSAFKPFLTVLCH